MPGLDDIDAPLFEMFWEAGVLNPTRATQLGERISRDAVQRYRPHRPLQRESAHALPPATSTVARVYEHRRSEREFGPGGLDTRTLSSLLRPFAACSAAPDSLRLLPSGGAKFPMLVHLALYRLVRAPALENRLAWYDPQVHGLVPTGRVPPWHTMARALGVDWPEPPAVVFLLAAHAAGSLRKYGERGGRFVLLEAGAYLGALGLQVAEARLAGTAIGSYLDTDLLLSFDLPARGLLAVLAYACGTPKTPHRR